MSIFSDQCIEVIEWLDTTGNTIVYRFPHHNNDIKMGAQLTVRESQIAVFINEGIIADEFGPGRYELSTENLPVMTRLKSWQFGFRSPFKSEVYFISSRQFLNQRWGTKKPIMMRDQDFGVVRFRSFGTYSYRVADPQLLLREIVGTNPYFTVETIGEQFKNMIQTVVADVIVSSKIPVLDLAGQYEEFSAKSTEKLAAKFKPLGFELLSFQIENISLPNEVEQMLDKRTGVGIMNDSIDQYSQLQAAESMRDAARNPGNGFAGMGVGLGVGEMLGQTVQRAFSSFRSTSSSSSFGSKRCVQCGESIPAVGKFCPKCGTPAPPEQAQRKSCTKCGATMGENDRFCPACGASQQPANCPNCNSKLAPGARFCPQCGCKL